MRVFNHGQSIDSVTSSKLVLSNTNRQVRTDVEEKKHHDEGLIASNEKLHQAVDSLNKIFELNNKQLKFVYHEGLEKYFVQLIDSKTEEVIKEIPPKKLLDAFYEMQKLVGMIIDEKR